MPAQSEKENGKLAKDPAEPTHEKMEYLKVKEPPPEKHPFIDWLASQTLPQVQVKMK